MPREPETYVIVPGEPIHPNHLPDLRYVLRVLQGAHVPDHQRGDVAAAINGMRYIIERTEQAQREASPAAGNAGVEGSKP